MKEFIREVLLYCHLIGFGLLLGGSIVQLVSGKLKINSAMLWGSLIQVITGIGLAAPLRSAGHEPEPAKLAVKAVIALLILGAVWSVRKKDEIAKQHLIGIIAMTLINAAVAVFWR
ncbi:hypothetical protein F4553_003805 [Allocatelliglobosispora scoriae]|uniref:Integral membrane protein n=1 Tax=Allocatelliglobosispora scoriae TaxID=643052 RepID=A0A841BSQ5_9ACTN|nr:hypothetical protein [Allocatelliglobosispora scoriae]MBB5870426.1 hypothetical protein [Allocatelliglobosispora scoriae]